MSGFRRRRRLWRDKAGGGVPPAFLFAVALAHPVVYSHFRILQGKKRKLYKKVWKKMRGFRRRRRLWRDKAGGEEKNLIKRRVERQKVFSSPPAINLSSFITQLYFFCAGAVWAGAGSGDDDFSCNVFLAEFCGGTTG